MYNQPNSGLATCFHCVRTLRLDSHYTARHLPGTCLSRHVSGLVCSHYQPGNCRARISSFQVANCWWRMCNLLCIMLMELVLILLFYKILKEFNLWPTFKITNILSINKFWQVKILYMLLIKNSHSALIVLNCSAVSCIIQLHRANVNSKKVSSCEVWDVTGRLLVHTSLQGTVMPVTCPLTYLFPRFCVRTLKGVFLYSP